MLILNMLTNILFWLVLLASWFIYLLMPSKVKKALLILTPLSLLILGVAVGDYLYIFAALVQSLSHARFFMNRYGVKRMGRVLRRSWILLLITITVFSIIRWLAAARAEWLLSAAALIWIIICTRALALTFLRSISMLYRQPGKLNPVPEQLPSVTLAIPARNETHVLTDCLRSAVASDYPKLEIIVLDDCSQDSTPQIIKSFAHDGVRFVSGEVPASGWIGKNQAYQTLLEQASGQIIIFAGVDVRWQPDSISRLINDFSRRGAKMVSIMPYRDHLDFWPAISRTLRYFWQMAFARLPVMNSAWVVDREWLQSIGGLKPFKHAILPERKIARLAEGSGVYRFIISRPELGISSRKHALSQFETAVRTYYPQSSKDPLLAVLTGAVWIASAALWSYSWFLDVPILTAGAAILLLSYLLSEMRLQPKGWPASGFMLPLAMLSQGVLSIVSMTGYEFGRVEWKGRNICLPVMKQSARGAVSSPTSRQ
jgi:hypothetical protein